MINNRNQNNKLKRPK